jgi:hypothetical protein
MKSSRIAIVISMCAGLSACGGEPSESDIRSAMETSLDQSITALAGAAGTPAGDEARKQSQIVGVSKVGCQKDGDSAYKCDVTVEAKSMLGQQKNTTSARLVKTSDGWTVSQ